MAGNAVRAEALGGDAATRASSSRSCSARRACRRASSSACSATARPGARWSRRASTRSPSPAASRTGRRVAEACGRRLMPCTLELGGKDPMIVCADADLERAARGAVYGAFANSGQVCVSTERVYVVDGVADEFVRKVVEKTGELRQGASGESDVGPMIQAAAARHRRAPRRRRRGARRARARRRPPQPGRAGPLLRADGAGRRRPRDGGDARRDLRPGAADHARARRGGGACASPTTRATASTPTSGPATSARASSSPSRSSRAASSSTTA